MIVALKTYGRALRGYDPRFWVLLAGFVISSMGFAMIVPFVSLYFHEELGVPMSLVGLFFLVTAILRSGFQGYAGDLSDRVGRARLMAGGQAARALLFGVMAMAVHIQLGFWAASGILALSYIAGAFFQPVASAAVADLVEPRRRISAYALVRVSHNLGWGAGPMVGGFISEGGYAWLFLFGSLASSCSAWLVWRFFGESHTPRKERSGSGQPHWTDFLQVRHDRQFMVFCGLTLLVYITMSQWLATLSVYASGELGTTRSQLGLLFGLNGFMVVVLQLPVTWSLRRAPLVDSIILGSVVYAVSFFSLAFAGTFGHLVICLAAITLGELMVTPPATAMVSLLAPRGQTGRYMGAHGLTTSFGWSVGPFLGGLFLQWWVDCPLVLWGAVASFAALAVLGFIRTRGEYPSGLDGSGVPGREREAR